MGYTLKSCLHHYVIDVAKPSGIGLRRVGIACDHLNKFFGEEREIATLKRRDGRAYRAHRIAEGVTDSTIRREMGVLNAAMRHAVEEERIDVMPILPLPPESEPRERWFTEDEVIRILAEPMSDECRVCIYILLFTGARLTAITQLTVGRVDFVGGFIDFRVPGARVTKKKRVKTKMAAPLRAVLAPRLAGRKSSDLVVGRTSEQIGAEVDRVLVRAGVKATGVRCHVFRRTFVTWGLLNGSSLASMSAATGDSIARLEKSYLRLFPEHSADAVNAIHLKQEN